MVMRYIGCSVGHWGLLNLSDRALKEILAIASSSTTKKTLREMERLSKEDATFRWRPEDEEDPDLAIADDESGEEDSDEDGMDVDGSDDDGSLIEYDM